MKIEFSRVFFEHLQIQNFMKIRPVGDELFHADGRTGMRKLIVAFRNFSKAPKDRHFYKQRQVLTEVLTTHLDYGYACHIPYNVFRTE
jgi:hypothetical protein